jgi:heterodisulfide reductase subunit D
MIELKEIINNTRIWYCLDCGKCSAVCPISRWGYGTYTSPRLLVEKSINGRMENVLDDPLFWSCLTCEHCTILCPSDVHFTEFLYEARSTAREHNRTAKCTHGEVIQSWGRMMVHPDLRQNRLGWITPDLKISNNSDTLFFVGCLPYYDPIFRNIDFEGVRIAQAAVKIMNSLGIEPQVLANENCCGHDQLRSGEKHIFAGLAAKNIKMFKESGAKRIISTCPECVSTLKIDYPNLIADHGMEVIHITELIANTELSKKLLHEDSVNLTVTYQDPCSLGRHLGIYDMPRNIMENSGVEIIEMERTREASLCCGTSCWISCGQTSKNIQVERLKEAKASGAERLITSCPKCQIHFKCAQNDPLLSEDINIHIQDLTTLIAESLTTQSTKEPIKEVEIDSRQ